MAGDVWGAVLTGGASRRMGRDKALIDIGGLALVERGAEVLERAGCAPVVAVGPRRLAATVASIDDLYPGEGPLGGILTALDSAGKSDVVRFVVVIACDLPDLDASTVSAMIEVAAASIKARSTAAAVIARSTRLEPMCAVWGIGCAPPLQRSFANGTRAVHRALDNIAVTEFVVDERILRNANMPDDLRTE